MSACYISMTRSVSGKSSGSGVAGERGDRRKWGGQRRVGAEGKSTEGAKAGLKGTREGFFISPER